MKSDLDKGEWRVSPTSLKGYQTLSAYKRFEERMEKLGVTVKV
jgi:hypothetical protein